MKILRLSMVLCLVGGCGGGDMSALDASMPDMSLADSSSGDAGVAASLVGLRWELPCSSEFNEWNCNVTDPDPVVATLGGSQGATYRVTLRFRGVVEGKTYVGGTTVDYFVRGGVPADDTYNVYALEVSDPPATYYLNAGTSGSGRPFTIDYTADVTMAAGATVTLTTTTIDGVEHKNLDAADVPMVVADVPPAPDAYDGQFIQMDVVAVDAD